MTGPVLNDATCLEEKKYIHTQCRFSVTAIAKIANHEPKFSITLDKPQAAPAIEPKLKQHNLIATDINHTFHQISPQLLPMEREHNPTEQKKSEFHFIPPLSIVLTQSTPFKRISTNVPHLRKLVPVITPSCIIPQITQFLRDEVKQQVMVFLPCTARVAVGPRRRFQHD